jgi:ferredoxin-NADP reductase
MANASDMGTCRVRATEDLTHDIRLFTIETRRALRNVEPGSHVDVVLPLETGAVTRSYSVIGQPADGALQIAVKRLPDTRGGSAYMWSLAPDARLTMSAPQNRFPLALGRESYLLVAGGIGITPLYGMALGLAAAGLPFRLLYAVRSTQDLAFAEALRASIGDRLEIFVGADGRRIDLEAEMAKLSERGELYVCGPAGLLEAAKQVWHDAKRPVDGLRFETFGNSGHWPAQNFKVEIPRLGLAIEVPRDVTLLDALERAGVGVLSGCRRGECGLCALPILVADTSIDHRDVFFSDDEKRLGAKLCTCVSRATGGTLRLDVGDRRLYASTP